jgi:hypothetical protein
MGMHPRFRWRSSSACRCWDGQCGCSHFVVDLLPRLGIENSTLLALEHNKDIRVLVQSIWLRADIYEPTMKRPAKVDYNAITIEELRSRHAVYFKEMDAHLRDLNKKQGKTVLYIVPAP